MEQHLKVSAQVLQSDDWTFQQTKHTSKHVKRWLIENHQIRVLQWPVQNPDPNPIETLDDSEDSSAKEKSSKH